ncbi:MAG: sulfotransferase domain-containing protein [Marinovum algicola]|uniref:sulfotransferase domain-containing protein n=1 Tax=Marinovum algicola TaxID=42444 RepID=UPI0032EE1379
MDSDRTLRRPRTIEELDAIEGFSTEEGRAIGLAYWPAPTDIFISPYAKCGTTWMQQIVHGLRSGGSMEFDEITEVVPWLELAHDMGADVNAPQVAAPRAFKSHLAWDDIPKGGRYIVVFRDPVDAMISLYRFFEGWWFEAGSISVDAFADYYLQRGGDYWAHMASWLRQRGREDVLLVTFEEMKRNLPGVVDRVADFMGGYDAATRAIATQQAGFAFMKRHGGQFDDHLVRQTRDAACGIPPGGNATKVASGKTGAQISDDIRRRFDERWQEMMEHEFGLPTYSALDEALQGQ